MFTNPEDSRGMQDEDEARSCFVWYPSQIVVATSLSPRHLTERDIEILVAFDRCPLTVLQLLKLSQTFTHSPFGSPRSVQDRLQKLREAGWVQKWPYAIVTRGSTPEYYKLTSLGYRLLYGQCAEPPTRRHFCEIGIAHHHHTHCLAEFIVHTIVSSHRRRLRVVDFSRENALTLMVGQEIIRPDCAFEIHTPEPARFHFVVELDNGTERVRSEKDIDSWQRKIRLYDEVQNRSHPRRFRVLVVTTRSRDRLRHVLDAAAALTQNPNRSLFYGIHLPDYLQESDAVCAPCVLNHRGHPTALVPQNAPPFPPACNDKTWSASRPLATLPDLPVAVSPPP